MGDKFKRLQDNIKNEMILYHPQNLPQYVNNLAAVFRYCLQQLNEIEYDSINMLEQQYRDLTCKEGQYYHINKNMML